MIPKLRVRFQVVLFVLCVGSCDRTAGDTEFNSTVDIATAVVRVALHPDLNTDQQDFAIFGRFAFTSPRHSESGAPVHTETQDGFNHACDDVMNAPADGSRWIAVVERGLCSFDAKLTSAKLANASAVIVYDSSDGFLVTMETSGALNLLIHSRCNLAI